jgi:putative flippase GtrA
MSFVRFCLVGLLNTSIGLAVMCSLMRLGGVQYVVANALGYAVGAAVSFTLNRSWTFRFKGPTFNSGVRWLLVLGAAFGANIVVVIIAHELFGVDRYVSQGFGIVTYTALSFLGGRFYAFRPIDAEA